MDQRCWLVPIIVGIIGIAGWMAYLSSWDPLGIESGPRRVEEITYWYRTVRIGEHEGQIFVDPDPLRMGHWDKVRWHALSDEDLKITFENSPFPLEQFDQGEASEYWRPVSGAALGDFKYTVTLGSATLDPVIRVEDDPPPGGDSTGVGP